MIPHLSEILVVAAVAALFFGARRIPEIVRAFGLGLREFRNAVRDDDAGPAEKKRRSEKTKR